MKEGRKEEKKMKRRERKEIWKDIFLTVICFAFFHFRTGIFTLILHVDQAGLELKRSTCLCLLSDGIKGIHHHYLTSNVSFTNVGALVFET